MAGGPATPFRDPRYAPRRLDIAERPGGEFILANPTPYDRRFLTMAAPLLHWAKAAPGRVWLAERSGDGWRRATYSEGSEQVAAVAGGLAGLDLGPDRPLLILARNGIDHALVAYAAMSQGAPVAPVSPQYGLPGAIPERLAHACRVLQPGAVYVEDADLFASALGSEALAGLPVIAGKGARGGQIPLSALLRASPRPPCATEEQAAKYLLTSGSTGHPKAVTLSHGNIAINSAQINACFDDPEPPVVVNAAPWSHSLGANSILHMVLHRGGTLYIDAGQPTAAGFGETLRNLREVTTTYHNMVPAGWMLLAPALEADEALARTFFERVRVLQYGGAALGQSFADRIQAVAERTIGERVSFASGYGATETGPTACNVHWTNARMGLIGLPIPGTTVRLVPRDGKLEFRVRGPQVTSGYLGEPERSVAAFDEEGFYVLGDAARWADPENPTAGLIYDGRVSENFKLATGAFVSVGELRIEVLSALGDAVTDAVVCGEGAGAVGLLLYPNPAFSARDLKQAVRQGLATYNADVRGAGRRVARALILAEGPDPGAGEITDKGYIAQALARRLRSDQVERLFAEPADPGVLIF